MKITKVYIALIISALLSLSQINIIVSDYFMNAIFTVMGIMFSIGMGLIVTFNLSSIKNKTVLKVIRENIKKLQTSFITLFSVSALIYIIEYFFRDQNTNINTFKLLSVKEVDVNFNLSLFALCFLSFSIIFFIVNFTQLQKLNNDILDQTL
ncbi:MULTISPECIES: hypothetical protein [unclassified Empedobacter]|uniref:hypothetical protein n=1 Tax=unclassified Empedobacter TaxID=2643773 RepID=UPI0025C74145|nr:MULTISPECIES: hypothetical protein [unclassified Empedobacter]